MSPSDNTVILPLPEKPDLADICASWSYSEWGSQKDTSSLEATLGRYRKTAQTNGKLPATWVCLHNDKPAGMISLKTNDHPDHPEITSWLASLFVHPQHRKKGIAGRLIETIEKEAKSTYALKTLHLYTAHAEDLYKMHGYTAVQRVRDPSGLNPQGDLLMKKDLADV